MRLLNDFFFLEETTVAEDGTCDALRLNPRHAVFQAHFPGNPITPGVCIIQMVAELLEHHTGRSLSLKRVVNVKFLHVLSPREQTTCRVVFHSIESEGPVWKIKASVGEGETRFAQLSMIFEDGSEV